MALSTVTMAGAVFAAEKPEIGPAESWVQPSPKNPEPLKAAAGAAVASLVQDAQFRFDEKSFDYYQAAEFKIQTAQGLQALSTAGLAWSPATDRLVVHRLRILRGNQTIDMLPKDGVFTIARREEKLDSDGRLDGTLTAIVKIDGLQVGDILDMAYTIHRNDPLFNNRVDQVTGVEDVLPIAFARIHMSWPTKSSTRWSVWGGMPQPRMTTHGDITEADIVIEGAIPVIKPQGAPERFRRGREFSVSNYADWAAVSSSMAPLFEAASKLSPGSPVKLEVQAIASRTSDPELRAAAALALVQDKIRYLAQTLGEGGLKPASADDTWTRRYGDCKAKTALLLALLSELGVKAEPALVSTAVGEDLDTRLPSLSVFNHVFVHAVINGHDYWLDGTRSGDLTLSSLATPNFGYVLPVRSSGATLIQLKPSQVAQPRQSDTVKLDASRGLAVNAAAHVEVTFRGDAATIMRLAIANMAPSDLDRSLRAYWHDNYDNITVATSTAAFDPNTGDERLIMDGDAKLDWSNGYEPDGATLGWKFDTVRDPASINPTAPFALPFPSYSSHELSLILPDHGVGFTLRGDMVDRHLIGYALNRQASISDGIFHMRTSTRSLQPEIPYVQAKADEDALAKMATTTLRVYAPEKTSFSEQELKALMAKDLSTANDYIDRGNTLVNHGRYRESLNDFNRAIELDPNSSLALGERAFAHVKLGEAKEALADADRAEAIDPRQSAIYSARGTLAMENGAWSEAIANFTRSIDLQPNAFSYFHRAQAYISTKEYPRALRDVDAEMKLEPENLHLHLLKAEIYRLSDNLSGARVEADSVKTSAANDETLGAERISLLVRLGDLKTARAEADAALAAHPTVSAYLLRLSTRGIEDLAGKEADAKSAHEIEPKNAYVVRHLTAYRVKAKDYPAALIWADKAIELDPKDLDARMDRANILVKIGREKDARRDFAVVRTQGKDNSAMLNGLCYAQAKANFDLSLALLDCDASLSLDKSAQTLDSKGFVLLRLGRDKEALAVFNETLGMSPGMAPSLYGRSLVERRVGDVANADKDRAAAMAIRKEIADTFNSYGVIR